MNTGVYDLLRQQWYSQNRLEFSKTNKNKRIFAHLCLFLNYT
jgi:hypothetical protein